MAHPVTGIDHVYVLTDDLDRSAAQWQRLGFTVTPRGLHSPHKGTGNHTMMLQNDYIELLGVLTPTDNNAFQRDKLANQGDGLHAIACQIADAQAAVDALGGLGIEAGPVGHFERPVDLPGGATGTAAFSTAHFAAKEVPQGTVFMCQHRTRPTVWVPEWMDHPNGATALAAVVMMHDDPASIAPGFARLYAAGAVEAIAGGCRVETGTAPILILTPAACAERYPGLDVAATPKGAFAALEIVADLDKAAAALGEIGKTLPHGIGVGPELGTGAIVAFTAARS